MTARYALFLWLIAVVVAFVLRYRLARFFLTFNVGGTGRGIPMNIIGFWLVLGIAALITLVKFARAR